MSAVLKAGVVSHLAPSKLLPDPNQPRKNFDAAALGELAANIKAIGIQTPLSVFSAGKGKIIIKDGERRWRAAKLAKLKTVPVLLAQTSADDVQTRLDQVAVNNLRESLKPMEIARFLVQLRDEHKLTPNEIAARLEKDGLRAMSKAELASTMKLVELKPWAQEMIDAGVMEAGAAQKLLAANDYPPALKQAEKKLREDVKWRGRVLAKDVEVAVASAFRDTAIDLKRDWHYDSKVPLAHFDYKKVCQGCEFLKSVDGTPFCLNEKEFTKKNADAIAAGLQVGGKKAKAEKRATPAQEQKKEVVKVEQRQTSLKEKSRHYLHRWLSSRLLEEIEFKPVLWGILSDFTALQAPGAYGFTARRDFRDAPKARKIVCLADMLSPTYSDDQVEVRHEIARLTIDSLPWTETQMLAHHVFGKDLGAIWKVDEAYLDLLQKAELAQIAETHCELPDKKRSWGAAKVTELVAAILAKADVIPTAPALQALYHDVEVPEPMFPDDEDLDDIREEGEDERGLPAGDEDQDEAA